MRNYFLNPSIMDGVNVYITDDESRKEDLFSCLDNGEKFELSYPLYMHFNYSGPKPNCDPLDRDILMWNNELGIGGWLPNASIAIVSTKLKGVLERFTLPPCSFYPVNLNYSDRKEIYHIFHIHGDILDHVDYSQCIYEKYSYNPKTGKNTVLEVYKGCYTSNEQFIEELEEFYFKTGNQIRRKQALLTVDFDFHWSIANHIRFTERIHSEIVKNIADLNGVLAVKCFNDVTEYLNKSEAHLLDEIT